MIAVAGACPVGRMRRRSLKMCSLLCVFAIPPDTVDTVDMAGMVAEAVEEGEEGVGQRIIRRVI